MFKKCKAVYRLNRRRFHSMSVVMGSWLYGIWKMRVPHEKLRRFFGWELLSFGCLSGVGMGLIGFHRFSDAIKLFSVACLVVGIQVLFRIFALRERWFWKTSAILIVLAGTIGGDLYLIKVVEEQQDEYYSALIEKLARVPDRPAATKSPFPTLRKLFKADFAGSDRICADMLDKPVTVNNIKANESKQVPIGSIYCFDYAAKAKFAALYVPASQETYEVCVYLAAHLEQFLPLGIDIESKAPGDESVSSKGFPFSGRVYIYHEEELSHKQLGQLEEIYSNHKLTPIFRGIDYWQAQMATKHAQPSKP